jgi:hypothetical protein
LLNKAFKLIDSGNRDKAYELIAQQTMQSANIGQSIFKKNQDKFGDENHALEKGQIVSFQPGSDGKFEIVDNCRYCGKVD